MALADTWSHHMDFLGDILSDPYECITSLSISKFVFYSFLFLHIMHYQRYLPKTLSKTNYIMKKAWKYVMWCHGIIVFATLQWFHNIATSADIMEENSTSESISSNSESLSAVHYIALAVLVVVLWDFGVVQSTSLTWLIPLNMHHVAVFIALICQPGETASGAWQNMMFFSWIWFIHSFSILNEIILPLFGIRLAEGQRLGALEAIRHVYAIGTAYLFHLYIKGDGQPGLGWNYQTLAVTLMMLGRFLTGGNWKNVPFMRRIELPGCVLVLVDYFVFWEDKYFERSFGLMLSFFICFVSYNVFFTVPGLPRPAQYCGPFSEGIESDPSILAFLQTFRKDIEKEFPGDMLDINDSSGLSFYRSPEFLGPWFDSQQKGAWVEKWKLFRAVACGDKDEVKKLLGGDVTDMESSGSENTPYKLVNQVMTDWHDTLPLGWAIHLERWSIILLLIESGANPYLNFDPNNIIIDQYFRMNKSSTKRRNVLFRQFFEKLNELSLKASPSIEPAWEDLSIRVRVAKILKRM